MPQKVIKVENVSKQYRLGQIGSSTISHDLTRWWHSVRGKEDPFLKIGDDNDRTIKGSSDYVWALRDINFDINKGEVVGIVGKNGAGKSTLLKILSRTTVPTTGRISIKGKVASLLEVGTGFHPELSGRDNVFLNGAILGMQRKEIKKKFDEIVAFAGVERYIDTPVKRYSSGMYIRLAFAVAAHLEPDILVVDEVLAVGDVEFQKKCLGKMNEVSSKEGRTILFVSHNMTAIKNICATTIFMQNGRVQAIGSTEKIIKQYISTGAESNSKICYDSPDQAPGNDQIKVKRVEIVPKSNKAGDPITVHTPIDIEIEFWNFITDKEVHISLHFNTMNYECIFNVGTEPKYFERGLRKAVCQIPGDFLNDGFYTVKIMFVGNRTISLFEMADAVNVEVNEDRIQTEWHGKWPGFVRPDFNFPIE